MNKYFLAVNETIKDYITRENISLNQFAKRVGVQNTTIYDWRDYKNFPTIDSAIKVADFLNCSLSYLFDLTDKPEFTKGRTDEKFLTRFELLRTEKGVTAYRIAKECDLDETMICKWKSGNYPKAEAVIKLAIYFNCSIDYLIGRSDYR